MNSLTTLEDIAAGQLPRYSPTPSNTVPVVIFPLESKTKERVVAATSQYPQLNDSFIDSTYEDAKVGLTMPRFAIISLFNENSAICARALAGNYSYGGASREAEVVGSADGVVRIMEQRLNRALRTAADKANEIAHSRHPKSVWDSFGLCKNWREQVWLTYRFTGLLPEKTRSIATAAAEEFGKNLFLVCDAQDSWVKTNEAPSDIAFPKRDPLLIGVKIVDSRVRIYLLDKFDITLAEDYLTKEFAQ